MGFDAPVTEFKLGPDVQAKIGQQLRDAYAALVVKQELPSHLRDLVKRLDQPDRGRTDE